MTRFLRKLMLRLMILWRRLKCCRGDGCYVGCIFRFVSFLNGVGILNGASKGSMCGCNCCSFLGFLLRLFRSYRLVVLVFCSLHSAVQLCGCLFVVLLPTLCGAVSGFGGGVDCFYRRGATLVSVVWWGVVVSGALAVLVSAGVAFRQLVLTQGYACACVKCISLRHYSFGLIPLFWVVF
jgi:hypothetical protein